MKPLAIARRFAHLLGATCLITQLNACVSPPEDNAAPPPIPTQAQLDSFSYTPSDESRNLYTSYGCTQCHDIEVKLSGPAFKAVALRYEDLKGAQEYLVDKVSKGGTGRWGTASMPPFAGTLGAPIINDLVNRILTGQ